jgi:hypothetical protein
VLLAGLIGGMALGLVGALMAIPVAGGIKVVLAEQLHARDAAAAHAMAPAGRQAASQPGLPARPRPHPPLAALAALTDAGGFFIPSPH